MHQELLNIHQVLWYVPKRLMVLGDVCGEEVQDQMVEGSGVFHIG